MSHCDAFMFYRERRPSGSNTPMTRTGTKTKTRRVGNRFVFCMSRMHSRLLTLVIPVLWPTTIDVRVDSMFWRVDTPLAARYDYDVWWALCGHGLRIGVRGLWIKTFSVRYRGPIPSTDPSFGDRSAGFQDERCESFISLPRDKRNFLRLINNC